MRLKPGRVEKLGWRGARRGVAGGSEGSGGSRSVPKQPWPAGAVVRPVDTESKDRSNGLNNVIYSFCFRCA